MHWLGRLAGGGWVEWLELDHGITISYRPVNLYNTGVDVE